MFGRVKRILGIEGVKIEIEVSPENKIKAGEVSGIIRFYSMHDQIVTKVIVKLIEKYYRGRRKNKLINEFVIGEIELNEQIEVKQEEEIEIPFTLPFEIIKSEMDTIEDKNLVFGGLVKAAKLIKGVRSHFRIEAEAKVKGTALNPITQTDIKLS